MKKRTLHTLLFSATLLFLASFTFFTPTTASAQNRSVNLLDNMPLQKVQALAKKENKLIFLDFGSPRCSPCLYMKHQIFTIDSVADFVNANF